MSAEVWRPQPPTRQELAEIEEQERERGLVSFAVGKFAVRDGDGSIVRESGWAGNAYGNDGKSEALNVMYRRLPHTGNYYLGVAQDAEIVDSDLMLNISEPDDPAGYARHYLDPTLWSVPSDPGDGNRQANYPQIMFGPATAPWAGTYVFATTNQTGQMGLLLFFLPAVFALMPSQEFLYTLSMRTRSS